MFILNRLCLLFCMLGFLITLFQEVSASISCGFTSFLQYKAGRVIRSTKDSLISYIQHNLAKDIVGGACIMVGSYYAQQEYQKGLKKMFERKYIFGAASLIWTGISIVLRFSLRQAVGFPMSLSSGFLLAQQFNLLGSIKDY